MGSDFVRCLISEKDVKHVTILDNMSYSADESRLESLDPSNYTVLEGDIRDKVTVLKATRDFTHVFNFAAETHNDNSLSRPLDFVDSNVNGVVTLLEAARANAFHLHQVSTDEVFGDLPLESDARFTESSPYLPSSPYSASKAASDLLVKAWVRSFGVSATLTNSANNFGQKQDPEKLIPKSISLLRQGLKPKLYGTGKNVRDWIHVGDHSSAVWEVATKGKRGSQYLISSGQLLSNVHVVGLINQRFGRSWDDVEFIDDRPGHDLMYASDSSKLRADFGWEPRGPSLAQWLEGQ